MKTLIITFVAAAASVSSLASSEFFTPEEFVARMPLIVMARVVSLDSVAAITNHPSIRRVPPSIHVEGKLRVSKILKNAVDTNIVEGSTLTFYTNVATDRWTSWATDTNASANLWFIDPFGDHTNVWAVPMPSNSVAETINTIAKQGHASPTSR